MVGSHGKPTSNCNSLGSPYASINGSKFNLFCDVDYPTGDLMSVWVYQFIDCIHACVSYNVMHQIIHSNETCKGVSFTVDAAWGTLDWGHEDGNCFLKGFFPLSASYDGPVDSAFYADLGIP